MLVEVPASMKPRRTITWSILGTMTKTALWGRWMACRSTFEKVTRQTFGFAYIDPISFRASQASSLHLWPNWPPLGPSWIVLITGGQSSRFWGVLDLSLFLVFFTALDPSYWRTSWSSLVESSLQCVTSSRNNRRYDGRDLGGNSNSLTYLVG